MNATMFRKARVIFVITSFIAAVGLMTGPQAHGQVIINDNFESYTTDASLTAVWPRVIGTSGDIFLIYDPTNSNQCIYETTTAGRLRQVITGRTPTDSAPLSFSFDLYDLNGGTTSGRVYSEIRNSAAATGLFAAGIYNAVNIGTYDLTRFQARNLDGGGWIQLSTKRSAGWHNFRFVIWGSTADLYVDNVLDPAFTHLSWSGNISYDWVHVGSGLTSSVGALFDNVNLTVVPEPGFIGFGMLGFAALLTSRKLRR